MIETPPPPVDVVPPCPDEVEALPRVLDRIRPSRRAIVVDIGSATDVRRRDHDAYLKPTLPLLRDVDTATDAASMEGQCPPGSRFAAALPCFPEVAQ
ncbi:hypothetical protein ACFXKY_11010 [Streptomyces canus]|uniref:hypothetical protein n=1 Tax=Streptomyces canus TaxID=58343 RepID=UPI0036813DB8